MVWLQVKQYGLRHDCVYVYVSFALCTSRLSVFLFLLARKYTTQSVLKPNVHVVLETKVEFAYHDTILILAGLYLLCDKGGYLLNDIN